MNGIGCERESVPLRYIASYHGDASKLVFKTAELVRVRDSTDGCWVLVPSDIITKSEKQHSGPFVRFTRINDAIENPYLSALTV